MERIPEQVLWVRRAAGLFPPLPHALLSVRGPDRVKFLHNVVSHDIKGLTPGQGRRACLLDRQGKIQAAFLVHPLAEEILLEMVLFQLPAARQGLERYRISEAVEFEEVTPRHRILPLHGPSAPAILSERWPDLTLPQNDLERADGPAGSPLIWILRWDLFGLPGFHLGVRASHLTNAGGAELIPNVRQASLEAFETLRIEAGVPWPGKEITESVILNELNDERWVSYTKGCFVGQEIVARIKHRAHPPRLLTGFSLEGTQAPKTPAPLFQEGKEVGVLTSACLSPTLNRVIALGFLKFGLQGGAFQVQMTTGSISATTAALPFHKMFDVKT